MCGHAPLQQKISVTKIGPFPAFSGNLALRLLLSRGDVAGLHHPLLNFFGLVS